MGDIEEDTDHFIAIQVKAYKNAFAGTHSNASGSGSLYLRSNRNTSQLIRSVTI